MSKIPLTKWLNQLVTPKTDISGSTSGNPKPVLGPSRENPKMVENGSVVTFLIKLTVPTMKPFTLFGSEVCPLQKKNLKKDS